MVLPAPTAMVEAIPVVPVAVARRQRLLGRGPEAAEAGRPEAAEALTGLLTAVALVQQPLLGQAAVAVASSELQTLKAPRAKAERQHPPPIQRSPALQSCRPGLNLSESVALLLSATTRLLLQPSQAQPGRPEHCRSARVSAWTLSQSVTQSRVGGPTAFPAARGQ